MAASARSDVFWITVVGILPAAAFLLALGVVALVSRDELACARRVIALTRACLLALGALWIAGLRFDSLYYDRRWPTALEQLTPGGPLRHGAALLLAWAPAVGGLNSHPLLRLYVRARKTLAVLPAAGAGHAIAAMLLRRRVSCTADATCLVTRGPTMAELQLAEARELGCLALVVAGWLGVAYASQVLGCCGMRVRAAELARRKLL